tara:strand:- start:19532 stop:19819 length:288 start_codon:yes stop_codon:yes gene_type:complete
MSRFKDTLVFDLTRGAQGAKRVNFVLQSLLGAALAYAAYRVAFLLPMAAPEYTAAMLPIAIAALGALAVMFMVALRLAGPQDARSFRLYRSASAK